MKKRFILIAMLVSGLSFAQLGVNTVTPEATLDIVAKDPTGNTTDPEGLLIPRIDRQSAQNMTSITISTIIYINNITNGTQTGSAVKIDSIGFYVYNGTIWEKFNPNIYNSDDTLAGNRNVELGNNNLGFTGSGKIGLGVANPSTKLDLNSVGAGAAIKITDGTQGEGKVLTSNADGLASWKYTPVKYTTVQSGAGKLTTVINTWLNSGVQVVVPETGIYFIFFSATAYFDFVPATTENCYLESQLRASSGSVVGRTFGGQSRPNGAVTFLNGGATSTMATVSYLNKGDVLSLWFYAKTINGSRFNYIGDGSGGSGITILRLGN